MRPEQAEASRAVLFGVHEFQHFGALPGVLHNVPALLDVLTAPDICSLPSECCATVPPDAPPSALLDALHDAAEKAEHLLFVYYAGHGHHGDNGNLLLATAASHVQRTYHSVNYEDVRAVVAGSRASHKVVIIDCCWSGLAHMDGEESEPGSFDVPGTCVLTSAAATEKSLSQPDGSVFTLALIDLLRHGYAGPLKDGSRAEDQPQLTMEDVHDALRARLEGRRIGIHRVPTPRMSTRDTGHRIPIARNRAYKAEALQPPPSSLAMERTVHGATPRSSRIDPLGEGRAEYERLLASRTAPQKSEAPPRRSAADGAPCPFCLRPVAFDERLLISVDHKGLREPLVLDPALHPTVRHGILRGAFQLCPHCDPVAERILPVPYLTHDEPLTVALVGTSAAGKTTLLTAMMAEIEQGALEPYGLRCLPLSSAQHTAFVLRNMEPLSRGQQLEATELRPSPGYAAGLLVTGADQTRPVIFFDVAGEQLNRVGPEVAFLPGAGAFIFVLDPFRALRLPQLDEKRAEFMPRVQLLGDPSFNSVIEAIPRPGRYIDAPAAVALSKSDLLSSSPTAERWLDRELPRRADIDEMREEARDAYAFVRHYGSQAWLRPFHHFSHCTLHFVSATGGSAERGLYPRGVDSRRTLAPLLSIFVAAGLLRPEAADHPGRGMPAAPA
ncbi:caspase domain-containing protein [Streptomyces sp. NPDC096319]|uniref:caspase family protein n=1 Tax=Streptomyces sp. NPDC096319 TaxID=3366084 RepID=UPI00381998FF